MTASGGGGAAAFFLLFLMGLYFVPLIVAVVRKVPDVGSVSFFLGWTPVGWVVALATPARPAATPPTGHRP